MAVTALNRPDFRTIATFRRRHPEGIGGSVRAGAQAVPGGGIGEARACGARRHQDSSQCQRAQGDELWPHAGAEKKLASEVASWFARAKATDAEEDRVLGADKRGDEMPEWVADKAALEQEAREPLPDEDDDGPGPSSGMMKNGRLQRAADGGPPNRAQRNFTDPESRIQPVRGGVIAGYNAQIAVDAAHQIIVAQRVQTSPADRRGLKPLLAGIRKVLRANPKEVSRRRRLLR
jgi:hypothetical protein